MAITPAEKKSELNIKTLNWGKLTWINIEQPTEKETKYLAEHYPFHPLDLDDVLAVARCVSEELNLDIVFADSPNISCDRRFRN